MLSKARAAIACNWQFTARRRECANIWANCRLRAQHHARYVCTPSALHWCCANSWQRAVPPHGLQRHDERLPREPTACASQSEPRQPSRIASQPCSVHRLDFWEYVGCPLQRSALRAQGISATCAPRDHALGTRARRSDRNYALPGLRRAQCLSMSGCVSRVVTGQCTDSNGSTSSVTTFRMGPYYSLEQRHCNRQRA